jgi:hypothetical protein
MQSVRFQVLMVVFWDVAPCSDVEVDKRCVLPPSSFIALIMEAVRTSETSVKFKIYTELHPRRL